VTTIGATLSRADRERLLERLADLRALDREMRAPGSLAAPDEPVPLHRTGRGTGDAAVSAARRRFSPCRCCGTLAASVYCDGCGAHHSQRIAVAEAAVAAIWGANGVIRFKTELRARRLTARRTTKPGRKAS